MKIAKNTVATFDYVLRDESGELLDSSEDGAPLTYLHGHGQIVMGLEEALEGKGAGESLEVRVDPEAGYGERDDELVLCVSREHFQRPGEIELGMQVQISGPDGDSVARVTAIEGDEITLDANHPLAGMTLCFSLEVRAVRSATGEELSHGHVHGEGGHHHG